jgi:hypothetical protein
MLPVSLVFRSVFLLFVYLLFCQFLWIFVFFFFILCTPYVASGLSFCFSRGNIEGRQDEEKQNDNPEKLATKGVHKMKKNKTKNQRNWQHK